MKVRNVVGVLVLLVFTLPASAQVVVSTDTMATCRDCFVLTHHLSIGEEDGPGFLDFATEQVTIDEQGRFWVALMEEIKVFGPDGGYLTTVGRGGQGPGEFQFITGLETGPDGTIYAFDARKLRLAVNAFQSIDSMLVRRAGRHLIIVSTSPEPLFPRSWFSLRKSGRR